jgi:hypothetical protein
MPLKTLKKKKLKMKAMIERASIMVGVLSGYISVEN